MGTEQAADAVFRGAAATPGWYAAAIADGATVRVEGRITKLDGVHPDAAGALAAAEAGDASVLGAVLRGLARLDGEAWVEPALVFVASARSADLRGSARFALAHSGDDRALAVLVEALTGNGSAEALHRSVHPDADARIRAALADRQRTAVVAAGVRRDAAALDALLALLADPATCRADEVVTAVARIGGARALAAVKACWRHDDANLARAAVRASLRAAPDQAWSWFGGLLSAAGAADRVYDHDLRLTSLVVQVLAEPAWPDPHPVALAPRLAEVVRPLARDPFIGHEVRELLRSPVVRALGLPTRVPPLPPPPPARLDFADRYDAGDHGVWDALVALGPAVTRHPEARAACTDVARRLMARVRVGVDAIRAELIGRGARLRDEEPPATDADIARVVAIAGPLPIALEAFWREVGEICLEPPGYDYGCAWAAAEGLLGLDPCAIDGVRAALRTLADHHAEADDEPVELALAADRYHKCNVSGGPPYGVVLPPADDHDAIDPPWVSEYDLRLVGYLRLALGNGGFPRLAGRPDAGPVRAALARGVLPF